MNTHAKLQIVDEIQERLTLLNAGGEDVTDGFLLTARLKRILARRGWKELQELPDIPKLQPITTPVRQLSPETLREMREAAEG